MISEKVRKAFDNLNTPKITLLHATPLSVCVNAIRMCWDSFDKSDSTENYVGVADKALVERVGNKNKHSSTLEHMSFSFKIEGISRGCLQELARHRMASLSVQSTRYTLKKNLRKENPDYIQKWAHKYIILPKDEDSLHASLRALAYLRKLVEIGSSNDVIKYAIPECFKTSLVWTINARNLQNFLKLRTSKSAWEEIRILAFEIFKTLPEEVKYLFDKSLNKES